MIRPLAAVFALAVLPAVVPAQVFIDTFDYPDGPVVPGWTQQRGTFEVSSGRITALDATWSYLTRDGLAARNCVIDGHFLVQGFGAQFGGFTTRHPGGAGDTDLLVSKLQKNASFMEFDRIYAYERPQPLGPYYYSLPRTTRQARCRMITLDHEFWIECDADLDGIFESSLPRRGVVSVSGSGLVGLAGYGGTSLDDFEFHDAVLVPQPGAQPAIGTTFALRLSTPSANVPFLGLLSSGNAGIPLGARAIPLSLDPMLQATLGAAAALGLAGYTDAAGDAAPGIPIPNVRSLVGLRLFVAAVTIDLAWPFGIRHISNEQFFSVRS